VVWGKTVHVLPVSFGQARGKDKQGTKRREKKKPVALLDGEQELPPSSMEVSCCFWFDDVCMCVCLLDDACMCVFAV
jgi:hypothetical protein